MPSTLPQERPALLAEREEVRNCQADWAGVILAASFMSAIVNPFLAGLPPLLGSVFVISLKHEENAIDRVLDDPPRYDFDTETRARSRRYRIGQFGDSDLAVATDAAVVATLRVAAYLEASVRADERAQGAEAAREEGVARTRLEEAFIFRERARAAEADRAIWLDALSVTWADWATAPGVFEPPVAREPARLDIRPLYRAAASRAGMVISKLSLPQPEPAEARQGPTAILEAVSSAKKLARSSEVFFRDAPSTLAGDFVARRREPALPEGYQQGVIAREEGDLERAESLLIGAANAGSTDAMYELGSIAMLREDLTGARKWFRRAMDLTRAELRRPAHRVMTLKIEPSIEQEERERLRPELPETKDED